MQAAFRAEDQLAVEDAKASEEALGLLPQGGHLTPRSGRQRAARDDPHGGEEDRVGPVEKKNMPEETSDILLAVVAIVTATASI